MKVAVLLADGYEEIEAFSVVDVLRRASLEVVMVGVGSSMPCGAHGIVVKSNIDFNDIKNDEFEMLVLPGGLPGAETLAKNENVQELIKTFDKQGKYIAAICAAPWSLDKAGVLKNTYTCYPGFENHLNHKGYDGLKKVIKDENIITSQGPSTAMDFALELVRVLCGEELHVRVKNELLY